MTDAPCPLCGGEPELAGPSGAHRVACVSAPNAVCVIGPERSTPEGAWAAWRALSGPARGQHGRPPAATEIRVHDFVAQRSHLGTVVSVDGRHITVRWGVGRSYTHAHTDDALVRVEL